MSSFNSGIVGVVLRVLDYDLGGTGLNPNSGKIYFIIQFSKQSLHILPIGFIRGIC